MAGILDAGKLVATLGLNTQPFMASLGAAQSQMQKFANLSMMVGRTMTRFVTLPMVLAGGAAINTQKKFEASMTKIIGLVGVSREVVEKWNKEVLNMSRVTGRGPVELADALYFVTSAGIRGAEAMEVLEMSAKASAAGLGETKVIADLVTSAMNAYGKENLSAAQATDILVASVREGKAEADELAGAMGMVLPIASEFGVSFDQVGAAFAGMTRTGTNARVAATQLKAILSAMASPSKQAADAMAKYNINAETFRKTVREKGLITALLDLRAAVGDNEEGLADIFPNIRALMGVLDLLGANMQYNVKIFEALTNAGGSLERAFQEVQGTTQQKLNVALATLQATFVSLGEVLKPFVVGILAKLNDKLHMIGASFQAMTTQQRETKLHTLALTVAIGPLLIVLSRAIQIIMSLQKVLMLSLGPFGLLFTTLVALAAVLARYVIKHDTLNRVNKRSKKVIDELNKSIVSETMQINLLFSRLKAATRGTEEWDAAKKKINSTWGNFLENLISEKMTTEELTEAMNKLTEARILDAKTKGVTAEMDRLIEENANSYVKAMGDFLVELDAGRDELADRGKLPSEFTTAMEASMKEAVAVWEEGAPGWEDSMRDMGEKLYAAWVNGVTKLSGNPAYKKEWMQTFFDLSEEKMNLGKNQRVLQDELDGLTKSSEGITVQVRLDNLEKDIAYTKDAEKSMGRRATLETLIGLEKQKNLLLDEESREINKSVQEGYEEELRKLDKINSSLGAEAAKEAEIADLREKRAKLSTSELEANSKNILLAEAELKTLQLETSGLSEIEKARGRIELMREKGLTLDGIALENSNKQIAQDTVALQLLELEASGLNGIEKLRGHIALKKQEGLYLDDVALTNNEKEIRGMEQLLALEEARAQGVGKLGILQIQLRNMEAAASYMNIEDAKIQQLKIEDKKKQIILTEEEIAGLSDIAKKQNLINRLEGELIKYQDEELVFHKEILLAKKLAQIEILKERGALSALQTIEADLLAIELLRLEVKDPERAAQLQAEAEALQAQMDVMSGDPMAIVNKLAKGTKAWFTELNTVIDTLEKAWNKMDEGLDKDIVKENLDAALKLKRDAYIGYFQAVAQAASMFADTMVNITERQKQKELSAAGDNAELRTAIEKKYYQKQKKWAIAQAIINGALAISNMIASVPGSVINPAVWIGIGVATAATAAQIAVIAAQSFAKGGLVYGETLAKVGDYPGAKSNPEVIAPLSDLKDMLKPKGMMEDGKVIFRIKGRELVGILERESVFNNSY